MKFHAVIATAIATVFLLLNVEPAAAHARLKANNGFIPRSTNAGLKTGPCGGVPRTATAVNFQPGETITVTWEETINHPGRFEFYFSPANDSNWILLKSVPDTQDNPANVPHQYTTTLTMPTTPCTACTLQMIQVMTENPASPSLYFSCADITIQSGTPGPVVPPGPTPNPNPCE